MIREARAFWLREPGAGEIRPVALAHPGPDEVVVRTLRSAVSRGTEALVFHGRVPAASTTRCERPFRTGTSRGR